MSRRVAFLFACALAPIGTLHGDAPASVRNVVFTGRLSASGTLTALVSLSAEGDDQLHLNRGLDATLGPERHVLALAFAREQIQDPSVDVELEEDPPPAAGSGLRYRLTSRQFASLTEARTARPLPRLFGAVVAEAWSPEGLAMTPKELPIVTGGPLLLAETTTIEFDESWVVVPPKSIALDRPFASYESTYVVQGTRLTVSRRVEIKQQEIAASFRPQLVAFASAMRADLEAKATWRRRDPGGARAALESLGVEELCEAGRAALERRDYGGARQLALKAKTKDPESTEAWSLLGEAEMRLGHAPEAETALKRVVELGTPDERALMALGQFYAGQERYSDAAQVFAQAVQRNPENARAQERLGQSLGVLGRFEESIAPFRAYVEAVPGDIDGYYALAGAYVYSGHPEQGKEQLLKGLARAKAPATRLRFATMLAEESLDTTTARRVASETLESAASTCRTVTLDRPPEGYERNLFIAAMSYRVLGMAAAVEGDGAALDLLRTSFEIVPHPKTAIRVARVLARRGRDEEGFRYFALGVPGWSAVTRLTFDDLPDELRPWATKQYKTVEALRAAVWDLSRDRLFLRRLRPVQGDFKMPKGGVQPSGVTLTARVLVGEDGAIEDSRLEGGSEPFRTAARTDLARVRFQPVGPPASRFKTLRTIEFFYLPTPEVRAFWEFEITEPQPVD